MKKQILFTICCLCYVFTHGQTNFDQDNNSSEYQIPEKTEALLQLYEEARLLENEGTAEEINQNRLAIKNEWSSISPETASLYKPVEVSLSEEDIQNIIFKTHDNTSMQNDDSRMWTDDLLLREDYVHGIDMETTQEGVIYLVGYENGIDNGESEDDIFIYKSTDNGASFENWANIASVTPIRKLQIISFDGEGDEYLVVYLMLDDGSLIAVRFDVLTGTFDFELINEGLSDFSVDRNYPLNTSNMIVFFAYLKDDGCDTKVFSARSPSGSYGMELEDEVDISFLCGDQIDLTYGKAGATYMTFLGVNSNNLYAVANNNFNDPASWDPYEIIVLGSTQENVAPTIKATRKNFNEDEVIIFLQGKDIGDTGGYNHIHYIRENTNNYELGWIGISLENQSVGPMDAWISKEVGNETIRTTYLRDYIDDSSNDRVQSFSYNGNGMIENETINDDGIRVWSGFPSVISETQDGYPCVAFVRVNDDQPYGLYFDRASTILDTQDSTIDGLQFYPNPTEGELTISANSPIEKISIFTLTGKIIKEFFPNQNSTQIDLKNLASGIYLTKIYSENNTKNVKLIKQ